MDIFVKANISDSYLEAIDRLQRIRFAVNCLFLCLPLFLDIHSISQYAFSLPVEHRPQTTCLYPALSCAAASVFFWLYLVGGLA